jgi:4-hydroxy-2-oxoheptanedioate aldolase
MEFKTNPFTQAIRKGEKQVGLWVSTMDGFAAEIVAGAGFDWVCLDMEHSPSDLTKIMQQLQVFERYGTTPLVRPDWNDTVKVKRLLDLGAPGLVFPMVQSVEEARAAVAATRYPPRGVRGVSGSQRGNQYGRIKDYAARVEDELTVIVQLETQAAIAQAEDIAAVDGVTGVFFGPADIAADMGMLGDPMNPRVWELIWSAAEKLIAKGMPVGTLVLDPEFAKKLLNDGFTFVACGTDAALLARATEALAADVKSAV